MQSSPIMKLASQPEYYHVQSDCEQVNGNSINLQTNARMKLFRLSVLLDIVTMVTKITAWSLWS